MKKYKISYYKYNDLILFLFKHYNHLKFLKHSFSEKIKKKLFFSNETFFNQSEVVYENKKLLISFEKINSMTNLKKSTSNQIVKSVMSMLSKSSKRLNKRRRINEF